MRKEELGVDEVEVDGSDGIVVRFTDGTWAGYLVEELTKLRPRREKMPSLVRQATDVSPS